MKRLFKRNQIMITALVLMIAAAGYMNYAGYFGKNTDTKANNNLTNLELLDISMEDVENENEIDEVPGEAVLTGSSVVASAKITREQVRAENKETLLEIINNENLGEDQKDQAVAQMVEMTRLSELEAKVETMLMTKGFSEAVVTLTETSADIVVKGEEITEASLAQIEDIVTRQTGIPAENIVINPMS